MYNNNIMLRSAVYVLTVEILILESVIPDLCNFALIDYMFFFFLNIIIFMNKI